MPDDNTPDPVERAAAVRRALSDAIQRVRRREAAREEDLERRDAGDVGTGNSQPPVPAAEAPPEVPGPPAEAPAAPSSDVSALIQRTRAVIERTRRVIAQTRASLDSDGAADPDAPPAPDTPPRDKTP